MTPQTICIACTVLALITAAALVVITSTMLFSRISQDEEFLGESVIAEQNRIDAQQKWHARLGRHE